MAFASQKNLLRIFLLITLLTGALPAMAESQFPLYPIIQANVGFWEKIYGTYTTRQGILHDKENLDIIYAIVNLVDWNTPGAAKINKQLVKIARQRYKNILSTLASGAPPASRDEKRISALFKKYKHPSFHRARDNIRLQIGQKDRFLQGVIRSGAYLPAIKRILRAKGLPLELAYLPHVESSFNPRAYSKVAAAGLWQFTRSTGRQYLTINNVIDERLDVYLATRAAADFLKENYRQLGSWPLALTAYNYGRAGMVRAQQQLGSYENIFTSHNSKLFRFASRNFYSEFLAALRVARKLEKDPTIIRDRPWASTSLRLKGFAKASALRKYFGVSPQDFSHLNPALRPPVLKGKKYVPKGYLLRLPATKSIRKKISHLPASLFHRSQVRTIFHKVRRGDTVSSIARKYHISQKELTRINHLNRKSAIRSGQKLRIPAHGNKRISRHAKSIHTLKATAKRKP
ncbi:MAG: lytic transglycosylase [Desulfobulbus sp.]|nr:MAG: lytic transglycosylase [Desulfobulbus sp.]